MDTRQFRAALDSYLKRHGFSGSGSYYRRFGHGVTCVVGVQKSAYSGGYYLNIGYVISQLHPSLRSPKDADGDIRARFNQPAADGDTQLFVPDTYSSEEQLDQVLDENFRDKLEGVLGIEDLKSLLKARPVMLYQTKEEAKNFLGLAR